MSRLIFGTAVLLASVPAFAFAHGTSKSYADWVLEGSRAELRVNFAPHDFAVALPGLDGDSDQKVTRAELNAKKDDILKSVLEATQLQVAAAKDAEKKRCVPENERLTPVGDPVEELQITATFTCPELAGFFVLETSYLKTLEPPHVSVATVTSGAITAQHIFTREARRFELELEPPSIAGVLGDFLARGARASFGAPLVLCLGVLCFLAGLRGASAILAVHIVAITVGVFMPSSSLPWLAAVAIGLAGVECLLKKPSQARRILIAAILGAAIGLGATPGAAAPMKIAFILGTMIPALAIGTGFGALAAFQERVPSRAIAAASLAGSIAMLVLALR